jgi:hypothetical protein
MVVESGRKRAPSVRILAPAGHGNEGDFLSPSLVTNALRQRIAAQIWDANIKKMPISGRRRLAISNASAPLCAR